MRKNGILITLVFIFTLIGGNAFAVYLIPGMEGCECRDSRKLQDVHSGEVTVMCTLYCDYSRIAECAKDEGDDEVVCYIKHEDGSVEHPRFSCPSNDIATCAEAALCTEHCTLK